jgi:hypothetical protein
MENARGGFNNTKNSKFPLYRDGIIKLSHSVRLDRLQFSLKDNRDAGTVMSQLRFLFEYVMPIREGRKFIHRFKHNHSLIDFVKWGRNGFNNYALIVEDPDAEVQDHISQIMGVCPMRLSQVEVAFDFCPDDEYDLYDLRSVLNDGLVVRYSRAGCYSEFKETVYIGKGGDVRKGTKGLRVYRKEDRYFLRMEMQFNRTFIKGNGISLPVDASRFDLFDYVDYRGPLDEDRLLKLLCRKWRPPIKRAADVEMLSSLMFSGVHSWIMTQLTDFGQNPVCKQMGYFKQHLKIDNLSHRAPEFFPKCGKKEMIMEDIRSGFVRRRY